MNFLDIELKILLNKAKSDVEPIAALNSTCKTILSEIADSSPDRMRYWINFIRRIHPLVDEYIEGQTLSSPLSDAIAEHIINTQADTQSVDLKYYFDDSSQYQPYPIRLSLRDKIPSDQLKMIEDANIGLNKSYASIMGVLFDSPSYNTWSILRYAPHDIINSQDFLGYQIRLQYRDELLKTFRDKYKSRLNLMQQYIPLQESIIITNDAITLKVEDKDMVVDLFGNKIINMPTTVSNSVLEPKMLE